VTLVVFLESWFALSRRSRLEPRRSSDAHGVVSLVVPIQAVDEPARRGILSVFEQSYPFIELLLLYDQGNPGHEAFVRRFRAVRSHIPVREIGVPFPIRSESDRVRALEHAQSNIRGSWILITESDVVMDTYAVESVVEFAGSEDLSAVSMIPGVDCRTWQQKLLAPSLEWFVRMLRALDRGREKSARLNMPSPFLLLHGSTHSVLNAMNRLPGVLNESGWTLWSYKVEGLRTFQGDGTGWVSRDGTVRSLLARLDAGALDPGRVTGFALISAFVSIASVVGILFGLWTPETGFSGMGILYFAAFSYSLMATSYYFYARRLGVGPWFAPLWFLPHATALLLTLLELGLRRGGAGHPDVARVPDTGVGTERQ